MCHTVITEYERLRQTTAQMMQIQLNLDTVNIRRILLNIYTELELSIGHYVKIHP